MALPIAILTALGPALAGVVEKYLGSKVDRAKIEAEIASVVAGLDAQALQGQIETNKLEAQHQSIFVSGWRPFIGWVCGAGLAYHFLVMPMLVWLALNQGWAAPPQLDAELMYALTTALLGMAGIRGWEKVKGKA